jgi:hypothetical protein
MIDHIDSAGGAQDEDAACGIAGMVVPPDGAE